MRESSFYQVLHQMSSTIILF